MDYLTAADLRPITDRMDTQNRLLAILVTIMNHDSDLLTLTKDDDRFLDSVRLLGKPPEPTP